VPHAAQLVQTLAQEFLVALRSRHGDLDEVVVLARHQKRLDDFRQAADLFAKARQRIVVVVFQRDLDHHRVRKPQRLLVQQGRIAFDNARLFQRLDAVPARGG